MNVKESLLKIHNRAYNICHENLIFCNISFVSRLSKYLELSVEQKKRKKNVKFSTLFY